jgi:glucosamine--fructose-6-phosphate aminotransferase (isomerizing)
MAEGLSNRATLLEQEIHQQPDVLRAVLEDEWPRIQAIAEAIANQSPSLAVIAARGSSDNAARYGKYLFGARNQLPVALATPSLFTRYQSPPVLEKALVLGISQSGQSQDVLAVMQEARKQGALSLAITNDLESPISQAAEFTIDLHAGPELSIAATKTYTASLMALALLSAALTRDQQDYEELRTIPKLAAKILNSSKEIMRSANEYRDIQSCVVIGRGFNYGTAFEISLKLKELANVLAEPYSSADFQHGPVALVKDGFPILAIIAEGMVRGEIIEFLHSLQEQNPRLIVLADQSVEEIDADTRLPQFPATTEWSSPMLAVIPGQLFTLGLSLAKGLDPDHPPRLKKVTITR